jgi:hypothetical protein
MSMDIEQFSYFSKLVALIDLYVELSLPLVAALRAAEADLGSWRDESSWPFPDSLPEPLTKSSHCGDWETVSPRPRS